METEPTSISWWVYLLQSTRRARTYIGIATDVERRLRQHNGELVGGARSTRSGRPWRMLRQLGPFPSRSVASQVEYAWKQNRGSQRLLWQPDPALWTRPATQEPGPADDPT